MPKRRDTVRVVAADQNRVAKGKLGHLNRRVVSVRFLGGRTGYKTCVLVIVGLGRLDESHALVVEIAEHLVQVIGPRNVVAVERHD